MDLFTYFQSGLRGISEELRRSPGFLRISTADAIREIADFVGGFDILVEIARVILYFAM